MEPPNEISRLRQDQGYYGFLLSVTMKRKRTGLKYTIGIESDVDNFGGFIVVQEELKEGPCIVYSSHPGDPDPVEIQDDETHLLLRMGQVGEPKKYGYRIAVRPN